MASGGRSRDAGCSASSAVAGLLDPVALELEDHPQAVADRRPRRRRPGSRRAAAHRSRHGRKHNEEGAGPRSSRPVRRECRLSALDRRRVRRDRPGVVGSGHPHDREEVRRAAAAARVEPLDVEAQEGARLGACRPSSRTPRRSSTGCPLTSVMTSPSADRPRRRAGSWRRRRAPSRPRRRPAVPGIWRRAGVRSWYSSPSQPKPREPSSACVSALRRPPRRSALGELDRSPDASCRRAGCRASPCCPGPWPRRSRSGRGSP